MSRSADHRQRPTRRLRRLLVPVALAVATTAALAAGVFPTRTYLEQRSEIAEAEQHLAELQRDNAEAEARVAALQDEEEIEHLARRDHRLARPGEETYVVLPPPSEPEEIPRGWPFDGLEPDD